MNKRDIIERLPTRKIMDSATKFFPLMLTWVLLVMLICILEQVISGLSNGFSHEPGLVFRSMVNSVLFAVSSSVITYPIFFILYLISEKIASAIAISLLVICTMISLLLVFYFNTALVPLGADLYSYSLKDILQTTASSGVVSAKSIIGFLLFLTFIFLLLRYFLPRIKIGRKAAAIMLCILILLVLIIPKGRTTVNGFSSEYANNLATNKLEYFLSSSNRYFFDEEEETDIYADRYIGDYGEQSNTTFQFSYIDPARYPFLHAPGDREVLGSFFNVGKPLPNIVFIIVEGLGRAFSNDDAYLGSFTPFIDSLSTKSLYWPNFLSAGGRTFAVLPSLMGSLPFGKAGFLDMGERMPPHLSLYSILKHNGYHTSFYYGGDAEFDNMKLFLRYNEVDEIRDEATFPVGYTRLPQQANGFSWGYTDDQLFKYYLNTRSPKPDNHPELNVILTVSTHDPFLLNNQQKYLDLFEKRMKTLGFSEDKKEVYRHYKLQYSSILYLNESLERFFADYRKRADFANTIFVITGDHRMPEIPMSTKIDRYHVPLLIYSPQLKRTSRMESISTHFDVAPSLLSYLKQHYQIQTPNPVSWMGSGLDTSVSFRNIHAYPLIQTKTDQLDFIMDEYHLNGQQLFKLDNKMQETPVEDESHSGRLRKGFDDFRKRNSVVQPGKQAILPDSLIKKYRSGKK